MRGMTRAVDVLPASLSAAAELYGGGGRLSRLGGERDANFLIDYGTDQRVLKFVAAADAPRVAAQVAALRHIEQTDPDLPVPRVCRALDGADWLTLGNGDVAWMLTFSPGRLLSDALVTSALLADLGLKTARLSVALSDFHHQPLGELANWNIARVGEIRELLSHVQDRYARTLADRAFALLETYVLNDWLGLPRQVIHGDLNPFNLVVNGDAVVGIIDFGDLHIGLCIAELGIATAYHLGTAGIGIGSLLAAYSRHRSITPNERAALPAVVAARLATTIVVTARSAAARPHDAAYLMRNVPAAVRGLEALISGAKSDASKLFEETTGA